jgi:hypothetical protein
MDSFDTQLFKEKMTEFLQQISMMPKLIYCGDYELRNQNFSNKATDGGKHGISLQKIKVLCLRAIFLK